MHITYEKDTEPHHTRRDTYTLLEVALTLLLLVGAAINFSKDGEALQFSPRGETFKFNREGKALNSMEPGEAPKFNGAGVALKFN